MRQNISPMPQIGPQNIMRQATTSRIARTLQPPTMPPVHQPPQTDPFTPGPPGIKPPTAGFGMPQPTLTGTGGGFTSPMQPHGFQQTPWSYEALMRSAGRPIAEHTTPIDSGGWVAASEGGLPIDPGPPEPTPINQNPPATPPGGTPAHPNYPPMQGPHSDPYGIDPFGESGPPQGNGQFRPGWPEDGGGDPYGHQTRTHSWSEFGGNRNSGDWRGNATSNPGGPGGGNWQNTPLGSNIGSGNSSGQAQGSGSEGLIGRLWRHLAPYQIGNLGHIGMDIIRRIQGNTGSEGGGAAGRNQNMPQGPNRSQYAGPGTHFDYGSGHYVADNNATGSQFNSRLASAMEMQRQADGGRPNRWSPDEMHRGELDPTTGELVRQPFTRSFIGDAQHPYSGNPNDPTGVWAREIARAGGMANFTAMMTGRRG